MYSKIMSHAKAPCSKWNDFSWSPAPLCFYQEIDQISPGCYAMFTKLSAISCPVNISNAKMKTGRLLTAPIRARPDPMAIIVGTMLNFPACKTKPGNWGKSAPCSFIKTAFVSAVPGRWSLYQSEFRILCTRSGTFDRFHPWNTSCICWNKNGEWNGAEWKTWSTENWGGQETEPEVVSWCNRVVLVHVQSGEGVLWVTVGSVLIQVAVPFNQNPNWAALMGWKVPFWGQKSDSWHSMTSHGCDDSAWPQCQVQTQHESWSHLV